MSEETPQKVVKIEPVKDTEAQESDFFVNKLNAMSNQITFDNYNKLITESKYITEDGLTTYESRMLKPKEIGTLRNLVAEVEKTNRETEWDKYLVNMEKQAELLIKDFNQQKFDDSDFYLLESIIVAWRMKYRGFRRL